MNRPILRSINVFKIAEAGDRTLHHSEFNHGLSHLTDTRFKGSSESRFAPSMPDCAERLSKSRRSNGEQAVGILYLCVAQKLFEKRPRDSRHVTGDNQVKVGVAGAECGNDASQRSRPGKQVWDLRVSTVPIPAGRAHQAQRSSGGPHLGCHMVEKRSTSPGKQGFIPPHPGTGATCQNKSGFYPSHPGHGRMIALTLGVLDTLSVRYDV